MNRKSALVAQTVIDMLLTLPWDDRVRVAAALRNNGIFCTECGRGSDENPNASCQCWNDE